MPLSAESRPITAFNVDGRQYQYARLPMGLSTSPGIFQRIMRNILGDMIGKSAQVYLDDIILRTRTKEEHFEAIKTMFIRLRNAGAKLNYEKCKFGQISLKFLGFQIDFDGYRPLIK